MLAIHLRLSFSLLPFTPSYSSSSSLYFTTLHRVNAFTGAIVYKTPRFHEPSVIFLVRTSFHSASLRCESSSCIPSTKHNNSSKPCLSVRFFIPSVIMAAITCHFRFVSDDRSHLLGQPRSCRFHEQFSGLSYLGISSRQLMK